MPLGLKEYSGYKIKIIQQKVWHNVDYYMLVWLHLGLNELLSWKKRADITITVNGTNS